MRGRAHIDNINAEGDRNGSRLHPEKLARDDRHGSRLHPESVLRGEKVSQAKLTEVDVRFIREEYMRGAVSQRELARRFGVSQRAVGCILHGKTWKHVQDEVLS